MYISTKEMVISIICNACLVIGFVAWAIEACKWSKEQEKKTKALEFRTDFLDMSATHQSDKTAELRKQMREIKERTHDEHTETHECIQIGKWYSLNDFNITMQGRWKVQEFMVIPASKDEIPETDCSWK